MKLPKNVGKIQRAPFLTPVWFDGDVMVARDHELIAKLSAASEEELRYIRTSINAHDALVDAILLLLECKELNVANITEDTETFVNLANAVIQSMKGPQ